MWEWSVEKGLWTWAVHKARSSWGCCLYEAQDSTQNQRVFKEQNLPKLPGILRQEQIKSKIDVVL